MDRLDAPDLWRERFVAALRLIGSAAARLPYGVPEPVLGGEAAIELYSGGLWPTLNLGLLTADPRSLLAELMASGFRRGERFSCGMRTLWHPALDLGVSISGRPPVEANVVAVEIGTAHDVVPLRVVGLEDLIVDQIAGWLGRGGRSGAIATRIQVLVELGRAGVGGPFRAAYLQRRLARETKGEAVLEPPPPPYLLDDPLPRTTSLTAIAGVVRRWRSRRNLPLEALDFFGSGHQADPVSGDLSRRNEPEGQDGLSVLTAQIIPFVPCRQ